MKIQGFSEQAQRRLSDGAIRYIEAVVEECYRLEAAEKRDNGPVEVTGTMVDSAIDFSRIRAPQKRGGKAKRRLFKIAAAVLTFISGAFVDPETMKNDTNSLLIVIVLIVVTVIVVTVSVMQED